MKSNQDQGDILSLRANVSESEAIRSFTTTGLASFFWRLSKGKFQRIAPAYVPFRLYRVSYEMNRKAHIRYFALDQVQGILDLFEFPDAPQQTNLARIETRNQIRPAISEKQSELLLREKVLRLIFQQGFFRLRQPNLKVELQQLHFSIPYWLGFYGEDGRVRCRVLDAVRRRMEGQKATLLFENWLAN
jgi:hypothetical protein